MIGTNLSREENHQNKCEERDSDDATMPPLKRSHRHCNDCCRLHCMCVLRCDGKIVAGRFCRNRKSGAARTKDSLACLFSEVEEEKTRPKNETNSQSREHPIHFEKWPITPTCFITVSITGEPLVINLMLWGEFYF